MMIAATIIGLLLAIISLVLSVISLRSTYLLAEAFLKLTNEVVKPHLAHYDTMVASHNELIKNFNDQGLAVKNAFESVVVALKELDQLSKESSLTEETIKRALDVIEAEQKLDQFRNETVSMKKPEGIN